MQTADLSHVHRLEHSGGPGRAVLLLHGTGGDESDLLPLGRRVAPGASLLSPRGAVLENGMPRFFKRLAEGVFDHEDVRARADALADFVERAREAYGLPAPIALGFSNGANIAAALLYRRPQTLAGAVLIRAMQPLPEAPAEPLDGRRVLILSGAQDPIIPLSDARELARRLEAAGAELSHEILPAGHGLIPRDVEAASDWIAAS